MIGSLLREIDWECSNCGNKEKLQFHGIGEYNPDTKPKVLGYLKCLECKHTSEDNMFEIKIEIPQEYHKF